MPIKTPGGILEVEDAKLRASYLLANTSVGIGTSTTVPDGASLYINEDNPTIRFQEGTATSAARILAKSGTLRLESGTDYDQPDLTGDIAFSNIQGGTTHMIIKGSSGNVGIGKESPSQMLDVSGNVQVGTANLFVDTTTGYVGVGTTAPGKELEVAGTLRLSDGLSNAVDMNVVSSTGLWNEVQKLTGPVEKTDYFGYDVSFSGDGTYVAVAGYGTNNRGVVYIFKNDGSTWGIQQVLTASDAATDDYFGTLALSKDGTHLVVGAYGNDDTASASGSAYIFSRSGNTWSQLAKLTASNPVQNAYFGINVDMNEDGSRVVISAWGEEAAYVYLKPSGGWANTAQEDAKLTASDGSSGDNFAYNVAMSSDGNYIVAGARLANKAYIFVTSNGGASWTEQQKITATDAGITDSNPTFGYGTAVSSDGTYVVISAPIEGDASGNGYGAVYVYVTTNGGTSWTKQQKLTASDAIRESSYLGRESALQISSDGSRIIVGAAWENDERGSAYVFDRSDTTWTQQSKIQLPTYDQGDYGGYAIAMTSDGQQILVSAHWDDARYFTGAGAVYVYKYDDSKRLAVSGGLRLTDGQSNVVDMNVTRDLASWATSEPRTMKVTSGVYAESYQNFGICVAISKDGNTAVVGSQDRAGGGASNSSVYGAVFVFERERRGTVGEWRMMARLIPNDRVGTDYFGRWVSISRDGSTIVTSSAWNDDNGTDSGCVYVFERPWSGWTDSAVQTAKLRTSDAAAGDNLGFPARISGDGSTIVASAAYDDDGTTVDAGKLNIWVKPSGGWVDTTQETAKLTPSTPATSALFGYKCYISHDGSTIIVGSYTTSAYVYERPPGGWTTTNQETAKFTVSSSPHLGFNCELSYDGSVAVFGDDTNGITGAVYVFEKPSSGWTNTSTPTATLTNSSTQNTTERFGLDVSISDDGNTIIASSYTDEPQMQIGQNDTGSVSVFVKTGDRWVDMTETVTFFAPEQRHYGMGFGHEVSLSGDGRTFCVGAQSLDNEVGNDVGAAYFFDLPEDRTNLAVSESSGLRAARYYGGIPTFLAYTSTTQTYVAATSRSTWFQVLNHEFDVPEEYHHLDTANLFISAEVRWFGESNAAWDMVFGLELRYGDNFEHVLTHQKPTFWNSHLGHSAAGVACQSYPVNTDDSSTPEAATVSSTFYLPGCPVRRGSKLFLALTMQTENGYWVYTNRTLNNHLGWNYENGTSHFFMALKVV